MARCTSAAATAESTPPDSAQMARPSPTCSRTCSMSCSAMLEAVQFCSRPATSVRKRVSTSWPCGECRTSGWYCTPASFLSTHSKAATGAPGVDAVTVKPSGASVTESPCDIHTGCSFGVSAWSTPPSTSILVRPYSLAPVSATLPPSVWVMIWNP